MRIVIDITDGPGDVHLEPGARSAEGSSPVPEAAAVDGGVGPAIGTPGTEGGEVAVITDGGPPPEWLLDAVAAAESAGVQLALGPAESDNGFAADAGAGPGPDAVSHDN